MAPAASSTTTALRAVECGVRTTPVRQVSCPVLDVFSQQQIYAQWKAGHNLQPTREGNTITMTYATFVKMIASSVRRILETSDNPSAEEITLVLLQTFKAHLRLVVTPSSSAAVV